MGEQETTTSHCRGVIDAWLRDSDPDFAQGTEYSYYPVQPCLKTSEGFYSIGAISLYGHVSRGRLLQ